MSAVQGFRSYTYYRKPDETDLRIKALDAEGSWILLKAILADPYGAEKLSKSELTIKYEIVENTISEETEVLINGIPMSIPPGVRRTIKAHY